MICDRCSHELAVGDYPFCKGRVSDHAPGVTTVIGDEIDLVQKNGTREPIHFRSKQERKRWLKANGYREYDTHVGDTGSDKSKFTTSWAATYDAYTAENVRILLERAFTQAHTEAPPLGMHINTSVRELTPEEAARYG